MLLIRRLSILFYTVLLLSCCSLGAESPATQPTFEIVPQHDAIFAGVLGVGTRWQFQRWEQNYLVVWQHESSPSVPSVALFDAEGKLVRDFILWFPEAVTVNITDVSLAESNRLIVSGVTAKGNGAVADFIAAFDSSGKMVDVIRTSPFVPQRICSTSTGSVWTYGWDRNFDGPGRVGSYQMLREYSWSAGQIEALLERSTFPEGFVVTGPRSSDIGLRCNESRVALYVAQTGELLEHTVSDKGSLNRWHLPRITGSTRITGYTLMDNGEIFASMRDGSQLPPLYGLFQLKKMDKHGTRWVPVKNSVVQNGPKQRSLKLLGHQGDDFVYLSDFTRELVTWSRVKPIKP